MLADFYIPRLSNGDRRTEKSFNGSNFVQKSKLGYKTASVVHHCLVKSFVNCLFSNHGTSRRGHLRICPFNRTRADNFLSLNFVQLYPIFCVVKNYFFHEGECPFHFDQITLRLFFLLLLVIQRIARNDAVFLGVT